MSEPPMDEGHTAASMPYVDAAQDSSGVNARPTAARDASWSVGNSYSRVLSNSMRKIMSSRPRMISMKGGNAPSTSQEETPIIDSGTGRKQELEVYSRFAAAVRRKDKEELVTILTQYPSLVSIVSDEDQLPLHLVCALVPAYFYVDVIDMMVSRNPESVAGMDMAGQTPLHVLCQNTSVTSQALHALVTSMPAAVAMRDKSSNLALHYLCLNSACDLAMLLELEQPDTFPMKNDANRTPLHLLAMAETMKADAFIYLLERCPSVATTVDVDGRSVLHSICESDQLHSELLDRVLRVSGNTPCKADQHSDLPLHLLCQNSAVDVDMLKKLLQANPDAVDTRSENDLTALHLLCGNESVTAELIAELIAYDKQNTTASMGDVFGATALHLLCMNESVSASALRALLLVSSDDSFSQDVHGRSPLHYLCMSRSITSELVWLFLERAQDLVREIDTDGKTPLHHLCANRSVTAVTLEIMYDACPSAAMVTDKELRLPIQYLVDNPSSPSEVTALLISGPASYRLRYDFLGAVGSANAVSFLQNHELVYMQTHLAMDSRTTGSKVWIKFFSSITALEHERAIAARLSLVSQRVLAKQRSESVTANDYAVVVHEDFEDAKRRVSIRPAAAVIAPEDHVGDTLVTLHYGVVMEAPMYTLESLYSEKLQDVDSVRAVVADVGQCLAFWHREALVVHGNVALECVGHFAERGLRLLQFHTSREFHEHRQLGVKAFSTHSIPPEAARIFLANDSFEPTAASDIWQFGCLIYQLATGQPLLRSLVPWIGHVGTTQALHIISSLTDDVIQQAIDSVHESLRGLLQATLLTNPTQRWTIDRLMHIDAFRSEGAPVSMGHSTHARLQRLADSELLSAEHQRSAKHALDQLDFIRKEQQLLRAQFLTVKTQLREREEANDQLRRDVGQLQQQLEIVQRQKLDAQEEVHVFARNHQTMTHQLHTTMQMLICLVPLANKVYGNGADEFLSTILSQSAGAETATLSTIDIGSGHAASTDDHASPPVSVPVASTRGRRMSAVEMVKAQLQNSILAHGCLHTWATSTPPSILEPHELSFGSRSEEDELADESDQTVEVKSGDDSESNQHDNDERIESSSSSYVEPLISSGSCFLVETESDGE